MRTVTWAKLNFEFTSGHHSGHHSCACKKAMSKSFTARTQWTAAWYLLFCVNWCDRTWGALKTTHIVIIGGCFCSALHCSFKVGPRGILLTPAQQQANCGGQIVNSLCHHLSNVAIWGGIIWHAISISLLLVCLFLKGKWICRYFQLVTKESWSSLQCFGGKPRSTHCFCWSSTAHLLRIVYMQ